MSFEEYLDQVYAESTREHMLSVQKIMIKGRERNAIVIHPAGVNGPTEDYVIFGNSVIPRHEVDPNFSKS